MDEEEDVYETMDEEQYHELVTNRREAGDFVVDDDGLGYYDDGEEVLGVGEDAYDGRPYVSSESNHEHYLQALFKIYIS